MSNPKKIALIGGAGFIGHHLACELVEQGHDVLAIDSLQINNLLSLDRSHRDDPQRDLYARMLDQRLEVLADLDVPVVIQDARDYHALGRQLEKYKPDVIFHAAAVAHAGRSNKDPYTTFDHSLRTLENALDYARDNVEHFIFFSSSMVYGDFQTDPIDETHQLEPIGIYGALKLAGEKLVIAYQQVFGLDYTIVRPSALYGPRCVSRRVGQVFIENAVLGKPLRVSGGGDERLDFTHIDDLVQGLRLAVESPGARNQIFNLTYGESRSIAEMLEILEAHFPDLEVEREERDKLMPRRGTLSVEKARRLLGYAPANPLELGYPKYIEWYRTLLPEVV
jgi:nucleoside-diphosphate-sugar epimerase